MAGTYYKYAERDADSQINWAQVGAEASGMLLEVNRVREEKKDALAQAQRESINNLMNSPQGVDQSLNSKMIDFAHNLIEQIKIDYDLLTRGEMSVRDYTLKKQNQLDGTNNLFEVTKQLQATRQATLDGIADGSLQSAGNIFNGGFVEKMSDLSNLSINVNSPTGEINLGMYEDKVIDGKTVKVIGKNVATPNILLGMVAQKIPTFYTDKVTTEWVKNMGEKKAAVYAAATTASAGTISEYLGPTYLASIKDPVAKKIASDFNDSIDYLVASKLGSPSNSYNLMGVLTTELKYGSDDFTYNSDEAKANPNKILIKINKSTRQMDLDETGANYERMKKEANDYVRGQIILKLDQEKKITTTAQLEESSATKARNAAKYNKDGEAPPPTIQGEYLNLQTTDKNGKTRVLGVTQNIQGLVFPSGKGVELRIDQLSYNDDKGILEVSGKKISGKEGSGREGPEIAGTKGSSSSSVVKEEAFVSNDIDNSSLLSTAILKFRNPLDPNGANFTSVKQAKKVLRQVYLYNKSQAEGKQAGSASENKKEINRADIDSKAKAAGYSSKEYEALLIKNGVTIK